MEKIRRYPTPIDIVAIIGMLVIVSSVVGLVAYLGASLFADSQGSNGMASVGVAYPISFLLTIIFTLIYRKKRLKNDKSKDLFKLSKSFKAPKATYILWGYILLLASSVVTDPIVSLFPESIAQMNQIFYMPFLPLVLCTVVFAPIFEEILFRGIIMSDMRVRYGTFMAIIFSSLLFGIIHMNLAQGIAAFFAALILGYIFYLSSSIWSVIFIHMLNNLTSLVYNKYFTHNGEYLSMKDLIGIDWLYNTIFILSSLLLIVALVKVFLIKREEDKRAALEADQQSPQVNQQEINE